MCRFCVYNHQFVVAGNRIITRKFIVLKFTDGRLQFTNYHKYIKSTHKVKDLADDGNNRFHFVAQLLNYCHFELGVKKFDLVTVSDIQSFLQAYGMCELPWDSEDCHRSLDTIKRCVRVIFDFISAYVDDKNNHSIIRKGNLYKMVDRRTTTGRVVQIKEPVFEVYYKKTGNTPLLRDIPNKAFLMLLNHITVHHTDILGITANCAFAGLRGAEGCNVRRSDSPLGPGVVIHTVDGEVVRIEIDLREELCLRSDMVSVGRIKKERIQRVPDIFLDAYVTCMKIYMDYMKGRKYEVQYGPLTVNSQGMAMTYATFRQRFHTVVNEMIPIYLADTDPEIVQYGRILQDCSLSPHVLRHWFTVQLVLSGVAEPGTLAYWRGDKSVTSALTYLADKGELNRKYSKVNNEMFSYLEWAAMKKQTF